MGHSTAAKEDGGHGCDEFKNSEYLLVVEVVVASI